MIVNPPIEEYLKQLLPGRDPILAEMESFGYNINFPILGPLVGTVLLQLTTAIRAKRILELGSGFGYSAYWFSLGIPEDGKIFCTDLSIKNKEKAENYFRRAGCENKLQFMVGNALEILHDLDGEFDIILNDVQKTKYPDVLEPAIAKLRRGGILVTDNVLRKGNVVAESDDESVAAIQRFNKMMFESQAVISSILPIRDGLGICVKK
ncbi:MAG TPA: O-methyltransferase [Bacteroidetes bacterium]|nr:O-methyltransferase [Bacteroidota bacterium]